MFFDSNHDNAEPPSSRRLALALLILTLVAYLPALQCGFIWDDDDYVSHNMTLRSADGLRDIWLEPGAVPQYYPLVHTTFWVEYQLWGLRPFGYHLVNVLIHAAAALLLWRFLLLLGCPASWLVAAVFALHPVNVESVAWITERKNVLCCLLYLAADRVRSPAESGPPLFLPMVCLRKMERCSMRYDLEVRVPVLDRTMAALARRGPAVLRNPDWAPMR